MKVLVVGNGPGGVELAKNLSRTFDVALVDRENVPHYSKPMLTRYIAGLVRREKLFPYSTDWYERNGIELALETEAKLIDRGRKVLITNRGEFQYDVLVLATGARARKPRVDGAEHILTLRSLNDADRTRELVEKNGEMLVVGGGFIGLELAANLAEVGYHVKLVHRRSTFLGLDEELSSLIQERLEGMGVEFYLNADLLRADPGGVSTSRGYIESKVKLCAIGITPNVEIARKSGIHTGRGVLIDEGFRTSAKNVYAIGDCAEYNGVICGTAKGATGHARVLSDLLMGVENRYDFEFRSTVFRFGDLSMAIMGSTRGRGRWLEENLKVFTEGERVVGAVAVGNLRRAFSLEEKIRRGPRVSDL